MGWAPWISHPLATDLQLPHAPQGSLPCQVPGTMMHWEGQHTHPHPNCIVSGLSSRISSPMRNLGSYGNSGFELHFSLQSNCQNPMVWKVQGLPVYSTQRNRNSCLSIKSIALYSPQETGENRLQPHHHIAPGKLCYSQRALCSF